VRYTRPFAICGALGMTVGFLSASCTCGVIAGVGALLLYISGYRRGQCEA
jgi:hypothetical protein